jgi:phosphate transport system substrate-binding protein
MNSLMGKLLRAAVGVVMAASVVTAPAFASSKAEYPVVNLGKCGTRNQVANGNDGFEYKCTIAAGGLKWKRTGNKAGAGSTSSGPKVDATKYANVGGSIAIDGSSTVGPLTGVAAEEFQKVSKAKITVGISGTGGGASKFCVGELDIANASAAYSASQRELCAKNGIKFKELRVATDALTVVVNPRNTWAKCLTTAQLKRIWEPGSKINYWNQLDPSFPRVKMPLFGAGTDSGTFEYFTEVINGRPARRSRTDYTPTEDDNVTVNGVKRSQGALGYYGFSYFKENTDINKAVQVDGGKGCVEPSLASVLDGTYVPLARPLYVYVNTDKVKTNKTIYPFLEFYAAQLDALAQKAKFLPLTAAQKKVLDDDLVEMKKDAGL